MLFDIFFMTIGLRFILVRSSYVWKKGYNYVLVLFVIVTLFLLRHNYIIHLFDVVTFFDGVRITFTLVRSNYVQKLRYKMVIFSYVLF